MKRLHLFTCSLLGIVSTDAISEDNVDAWLQDSPIQLLQATRLETAVRDAPAATTIITSKEIEKYRFRNVPEALRMVPGFIIGQSQFSYERYWVGYHGGNSAVPRRMNLIIDGVSYFEGGISRIHWEKLPISMDEIAKIEVIRGPMASLYGSNSFNSVVNIITKSPKETLGELNDVGVTVEGRAGANGIKDGTVSFSDQIDDFVYRVSIGHTHDNGFDRTAAGINRHDSNWINRISIRSVYDLSENEELSIDASLLEQYQQEQFINPLQTNFPDYTHNTGMLSIRYDANLDPSNNVVIKGWVRTFEQEQSWGAAVPGFLVSPALGELHLNNQAYANAIAAGLNPVGTGGTENDDLLAIAALTEIGSIGQEAFLPINTTVPQNFEDNQYEVEVQHTYSNGDDLRVVSGVSVNRVSWEMRQWVIDGKQELTTFRAFSNTEYRYSDNLVLHGGAMFEYDDESGSSISPRLGVNYHFTNNHTFRAVYSSARRTPDGFEQFADWRLIGENPSSNPYNDSDFLTFFQRAVSPGNLEPEKIRSTEFGYYYTDDRGTKELDVRVFHEEMYNLISEKLQLSDFRPTNNGFVDKTGIEVSGAYMLSDFANVRYGLTLMDVEGVRNEQTFTSEHSGYVGLEFALGSNTDLAVSYYAHSGLMEEQTSENPADVIVGDSVHLVDITLQHKLRIKNVADASIFLQTRVRNDDPELQLDNFYDDEVQTAIGFVVSF